MLRQPRSRGRQDFPDLGGEVLGSQPSETTQFSGPLPSQPHSTTCSAGSAGLEETTKCPLFNMESGADHTRVTMKTRIAVRDKTPHRFQVVSLREVGKLETSSASQSENSSRLHVSTVPQRSILRPTFEKSGSPYQSKRQLSSSSRKHSMGNLYKALDQCNKPEVEPAPQSSSEIYVSAQKSASDIILSSVALPEPRVLSVLDTNLLQQRRYPPQAISDPQIASSIPSLSSNESIIQLIRSESPLTHTISRSLQVRSRHERNHPKFSSLSNFQSPEVSQRISVPRSTNRHARTKSDAHISSRFSDSATAEDGSYHALLDPYDAVDPKSRKRHAIYTPSLYVPAFDQFCQFKENTDLPMHTNRQSASTSWEPVTYPKFHLDSASHYDSESNPVPNHKTYGHDIKVHDDDSKALRYTPQDISDTMNNGPMICLPVSTREHHLTHKSSSQNLRLRIPDELKSSKALRRQSSSVTRDQRLLGEVIFPPIVLDLIADIDRAIEDWNRTTL